jgi:hypothetical protein
MAKTLTGGYMPEYERLGIVNHVDGTYIDLGSPKLFGSKLEIEDGKAILRMAHLDFWKIFLSMLQEISGDHIACHMPSHGLRGGEKDLDMVEAIAENMSRILKEMGENTDWDTAVTRMVERRMARERALPESTTGG